jgi:hypothetical protein
MSIASAVLRFCAETVKAAFDVLVIQPLHGLKDILAGVAQAGPKLVQAVASATVQAVEQHLSPDGQAKVEQGGKMILTGAKRMIAPAVVAVGFWICWNPGVLYLASAAWVLVMAMCLVAD